MYVHSCSGKHCEIVMYSKHNMITYTPVSTCILANSSVEAKQRTQNDRGEIAHIKRGHEDFWNPLCLASSAARTTSYVCYCCCRFFVPFSTPPPNLISQHHHLERDAFNDFLFRAALSYPRHDDVGRPKSFQSSKA